MGSRSAKNSKKSKKTVSSKNLFNEISSILVFALGVFVAAALLTYHPQDPSFFSTIEAVPKNACGKLGAYLASLLLQTFGLGAFLLPAALVFVAATIHHREGLIRFMGIMGGMTVAVIALTVLLTLQWRFWPYQGSLLLTGGAFGAWLGELLMEPLNRLGATIVAAVVFTIALVLSTPVSIARLLGRTLTTVSAVSIKATKIAASYLIYIIGLVGMKTAHATGDILQKGIEGAVRRAKERRQAFLDAREKVIEIAQSKPVAESPQLPDIGDEPQLALLDESELDAGDGEETVEEFKEDVIDVGEIAKNVPEIVPRQNMAASKAAEKLAKAAAKRTGQWKLPAVSFLEKPGKVESAVDKQLLIENSQILKNKLSDFGIDGDVTAVRPGPVITLYEFKPGPGVKVSRIAALADDLSMALSAESVRILAPIPGKSVIGIEIPSDHREKVFLREFFQDDEFYSDKYRLPVAMGKDIAGKTVYSDLSRMPHLLCAGQTGSGKSVFMNSLICSLLYRFTPDELRLILVDPKYIEFRSFQDLPHLLLPVVDDAREASTALKWAVREMERRYRILGMLSCRNLEAFNKKVESMGTEVVHDVLMEEENKNDRVTRLSGKDWIESFEIDENGVPQIGKIPNIVVIIDELADLMMVAKKDVEISIARIAQKARAAGIHLVVATQRPSTDVITGLIKANLPSRLSFQLASYVDSKTILDRAGAERLLGQGDMLFIPPGVGQAVRLHGAFVQDAEIEKVTAFLRSQGEPVYRDEILVEDEESSGTEDEDLDELFEEATELVKRSGHASASFLQRHLKVGYNRAARMIETMEGKGIVGPADGSRPREVLVN